MDTATKRFYRAKEAAVYLGVEVSTVWRYAKAGKLKAIKQTKQLKKKFLLSFL